MSWHCRRDLVRASRDFVLGIALSAGVARGQEFDVFYEIGDLCSHLSKVRGFDPQTDRAGRLMLELLQQRFADLRLGLSEGHLVVTRLPRAADPLPAHLQAWRHAAAQESKLRFEVAVARVPKAKFAELQLAEKVQTLRDRAPLTELLRRVSALGGSLAVGDRDAVEMFGRVEMKVAGTRVVVDALPDEVKDQGWTVALHCHRPTPPPVESPASEPRREGADGSQRPTTPFRCCVQLRLGETQVRELPADPAVDFRELLIVTWSAHDAGPELVPPPQRPMGVIIKRPLRFQVGLPPMPPAPAIR